MLPAAGRIRRRLLGLSPDEASFERRGFRGRDPGARARLERIGRTFLQGYHFALEEPRVDPLAARLEAIDRDDRGFGYEGAAMALALLDRLWPGRGGRLRAFLERADDHIYMVHVGAGWAIARIPWLRRDVGRAVSGFDPLLRWLAVDGFGFHEGYFRWPRRVVGREVPRGLGGYARRAFDQGLGRSLWFVEGADVDRVAAAIVAFPEGRRDDLWSGVGLACTYAGGVDEAGLETLRRAMGPHRPSAAQGAAFAAKARQRAGNPTEHTERACRALCGRSADEAAAATDLALADLPPDGDVPSFEVWRRRIATLLTAEEAVLS